MLRSLVLVVSLVPLSAWAQEPPRPNLKAPVDYVAWMNAEFGKDIKVNAAAEYQKAFDAYVDNASAREIAKRAGGAWSAKERFALEDWVAANEGCLSKFVAASQMPRCYFARAADSGSLLEVLLPYMRATKDVACLLGARARLRLDEGDNAGAVADVCALLRCGEHLRAQPTLIEYLVGVAVSNMAYEALFELPVRATQRVSYDEVLKALKQADRPVAGKPTRALLGEKLMVWDAAQRLVRDKDGDGRLDSVVEIPEILPAGIKVPATLEEILREYDAALEKQATAFSEDYGAALRAEREAGAQLAAQRNTFPGALVPNYHRIGVLQRRLAARRSASRIVLRCHAFHAKQNRWPADLTEATAGEPAALRKDPFSGQDFAYRLEGGQPLLYSVGANGKDDAGKRATDGSRASETGDIVFWPLAEQ